MPALIGAGIWLTVAAVADGRSGGSAFGPLGDVAGGLAVVGGISIVPGFIVGERWAWRVVVARPFKRRWILRMALEAVLLGDVIVTIPLWLLFGPWLENGLGMLAAGPLLFGAGLLELGLPAFAIALATVGLGVVLLRWASAPAIAH